MPRHRSTRHRTAVMAALAAGGISVAAFTTASPASAQVARPGYRFAATATATVTDLDDASDDDTSHIVTEVDGAAAYDLGRSLALFTLCAGDEARLEVALWIMGQPGWSEHEFQLNGAVRLFEGTSCADAKLVGESVVSKRRLSFGGGKTPEKITFRLADADAAAFVTLDIEVPRVVSDTESISFSPRGVAAGSVRVNDFEHLGADEFTWARFWIAGTDPRLTLTACAGDEVEATVGLDRFRQIDRDTGAFVREVSLTEGTSCGRGRRAEWTSLFEYDVPTPFRYALDATHVDPRDHVTVTIDPELHLSSIADPLTTAALDRALRLADRLPASGVLCRFGRLC